MDVVVTGRKIQLSDRFRQHVEDKMDKVEQLAPRAMRVDVQVTHEPTRKTAKAAERVEITCHVRGPVIRAEASHDDKFAAFDMAMDKLVERLRRGNEKRRVSRRRALPDLNGDAAATPDELLGVATASAATAEPSATAPTDTAELVGAVGDSPIEVREKVHASQPMTLSDALRDMELVGHDFFLFHDSDTGKPSVVYRRQGWKYGVIHLDVTAS